MFDLETLRSKLRLDASGFTAGLSGAEKSLSGFGQRMGGAGRGLLDFGQKLGLTTLGLRELAGIAKGAFNALFGGNIAIENVKAQLLAFTGSAEQAEKILADIRTEAAKTPFAFNEMAAATAGLIPASKQSGVALMDLVKQAEILAAVNPAEGLEGAAFALREALSGDFTSIIERFNLPRQRLNELKAQGVPAIEAIQIALKEMGIDASIVSNMANTATGRWSTFTDTLNTIKDTALHKTFEMLSQSLVPIQAWLDKNNEKLTKLAELAGEKLAKALERLGHWVRENRDQMLRFARTGLAVVTTGFRILWPIVSAVFGFLGRHRATIARMAAAFAAAWAAISAGTAVFGILVGAIAVLTSPLLLIAAAVALLALAWTKNWFGIRDKTKAVIDFVMPYIRKVIDVVSLLGEYFRDVATNQIQPGNLAKLPKWLRPIAYILGRLIKTVRVFIKAWQAKGFLAALNTIPTQIRALGRAVANLFAKMGLTRFADAVRQTFNDVARLFKDIVALVDDIVNGRWREVWGDLGRIAMDLFRLFLDRWKMSLALLKDLFEMIPWGQIGKALAKGVVAAVVFMISVGAPFMLDQGKALLRKLWKGIKWSWENVLWPGFVALPQLLLDLLVGYYSALYDIGNFLLGAFWSGLSFAWDWGTKWVGNLPGWIVDQFAWWFNSFYSIGKFLVSGFWKGFSAAWNWAMEEIDKAISALSPLARKILGVMSPSKVFADIGENVGLGFAKGALDAMPKVQQAINAMASVQPTLAGPAAGSVAMAGGGTRQVNVTVAPGAVVVNGVQDANRVAAQLLQAIRTAEEGAY